MSCQALVFKRNKSGITSTVRRPCRKVQRGTVECRIGYTIHVAVCNDPACGQAAYQGHFEK